LNQQPDSPGRNAGRHPEVRRHFHDELSELKAKLLTMSANAQEALDIAVDAALTGDDALAAQVIAGDRTLDALHAVNIAESAERLHRNRLLLAPEHELAEMARQARAMLSGALDAFVRGDARLGREICRQDDGVDALRNSVFRVLLTHMMEDPRSIGPAMQLFLVSRNLERVADLATNIAEDVVFLVEGKTIKHHAEETPPPDAAPGTPGSRTA